MNDDDLMRVLNTPKDWNNLNNRDKADILVLSFIGMVARPKNIPEDVLEKCVDAFNNNRGKMQKRNRSCIGDIK